MPAKSKVGRGNRKRPGPNTRVGRAIGLPEVKEFAEVLLVGAALRALRDVPASAHCPIGTGEWLQNEAYAGWWFSDIGSKRNGVYLEAALWTAADAMPTGCVGKPPYCFGAASHYRAALARLASERLDAAGGRDESAVGRAANGVAVAALNAAAPKPVRKL